MYFRALALSFLLFVLQTTMSLAALTLFEANTSSNNADKNSAPPKQDPLARNLVAPDGNGQKFEGPAAKAFEAFADGRFDEAVKLAEPLANQNDADALYLMGIANETGQGVTASREKALGFYQRAAKLAHKDAPLRTSLILLSSDKYQEREDARKLLEETADKDAKVAGRILGEAWLRGLLSDNPDPNQAVTWWKKAASEGDLPSIRVLASFYEGQLGFPELNDPSEAVKFYNQAAAMGDPGSMVILGSRLLNGEKSLRNETKGMEWLNKAAEADETSAHFVIGDYQESVKKSDKAALAAYQRGADAGQPDCMVRLANFHLEGRVVKKDESKALEILKQAAEKGSGQAQFQVAMMLLSDEKPDLGTAYLNLLSAANGNLPPAQNELGLLYLGGQMGLSDPTAAVAWLTRAAKAGHAPAQNNLAALYESGSAGLQRNMQNAGELYTLAANQGHPDAILALVRLTLQNNGDEQNLIKAWAQTSLIAEQGHEGAANMVKQIAENLNEKQLEEAKKLLKELKTSQGTPK